MLAFHIAIVVVIFILFVAVGGVANRVTKIESGSFEESTEERSLIVSHIERMEQAVDAVNRLVNATLVSADIEGVRADLAEVRRDILEWRECVLSQEKP